MQLKLKFIALLLFFSAPFVSAQIIECQKFSQIIPHIDQKSCLFLEIDDILVSGNTAASTPSFFNHLKQELLEEGYEYDQITNKLYPIWVKVQKASDVQLKEPDIVNLLNALEKKEIPVFALSHRGPRLAHHTLDQLHKLDIFFDKLASFKEDVNLEDNLAMYFEGMLLLHPICNKGKYLTKFFDKVHFNPQKVICVDNELINLVHLQQALDELNVPFLGIYMRNAVEPCDINLAKLQLQYLDQILPDHVAKIISDSHL